MKKVLLLLLLISAFIIAGCGPQQTTYGNPFMGGTKGLDLKFVPGAPPSEIFDDKSYPFSIQVQVTNVGEDDISGGSEGYIEIMGLQPQEYGVSAGAMKQSLPALTGSVKNNNGNVIQGDTDIVTFDGFNYQANIVGNLNTGVVRAVACYDYTTMTSSNLCVKKEAIDLEQSEICKINGDKEVYNSAGPVQILSMKEGSVGRDAIQVVFEIGSRGAANEYFFRLGTSECNTRPNNPDRYMVFVDVKPILNGAIPAVCSGWQQGSGSSGYIMLPQGASRTLTCKYDTNAVSNDAVVPMNVNLRYRYMQFIEQPITIKDVSTNERN